MKHTRIFHTPNHLLTQTKLTLQSHHTHSTNTLPTHSLNPDNPSPSPNTNTNTNTSLTKHH